MVGDREDVVGEAIPRVGAVADRGDVAVAVAVKVERPDLVAGADQRGCGLPPNPAVEAGRVREQDGRSVPAPVVDHEAQPVGDERMRDGRHGEHPRNAREWSIWLIRRTSRNWQHAKGRRAGPCDTGVLLRISGSLRRACC